MESEIRIAIVVNPALGLGLLANTVGAISIGLGAGTPALAGRKLTDRSDRTIDVSSRLPVPILQADQATIQAILLKAVGAAQGSVVAFPAFARALHQHADYEQAFPGRDLAQEEIDGIGLVGPSSWVRSLTGALKLLR
ncbi:DUF2000 domain-containing protein [Pandoraea pulmonicola]|uniref:Protein of uncharacterized function (DUF2000) n=1 Tax=Pandoraea pulmonicola TaxID=93221 RepID=A0AAJ4ZG59_PANPU|nr:DUF2000 domain-containing protein [Pandoraea pulmonicola]AJC22899.1 hypothetical protein RO07_25015 [Pandoraea pulmonicola]SUA92773.1 Protein of uncharacterised function (DUF2000) [Pandoraea pulmonicola]